MKKVIKKRPSKFVRSINKGLKVTERKLRIATKALNRSLKNHVIELKKLDAIRN